MASAAFGDVDGFNPVSVAPTFWGTKYLEFV